MIWHIYKSNGASGDLIGQGHPVIQVTWEPSVYWSTKENFEWMAWSKSWPEGGLMFGSQMVLWEKAGWDALPFLRYKSSPRQERTWNPYCPLKYDDYARRLLSCDQILESISSGITIEMKDISPTLKEWLDAGGQGNEGAGILPHFTVNAKSQVILKSQVRNARILFTLEDGEKTKNVEVTPRALVYTQPIAIGATRIPNKIILNARLMDESGKPVLGTLRREFYTK